jgi:hypothetical protein
MTGTTHLRIVTTIFIVSGIFILLPYVMSLFLDGLHTPPIGLIGGIGSIAVAVWFSRGSNIARYLLIVSSILGLLICLFLLFVGVAEDGPTGAVIGVTAALSAYCLWVLMFSKDVRAEFARRREANKIQDLEERRKFYEQLGEKVED